MENPPENSENHPCPPGANNNDNQPLPSGYGTNLDGVNNLVSSGNVGDFVGLATSNDVESFPIGYRFVPTDDYLISGYLIPKIKNERLPPIRFHEEDIYKFSPEELTERYKSQGEKTWYFFTPRERKYMNGSLPRRSAGDGYWRASGVEKQVHENGVIIGSRKPLAYYKGKSPYGDRQPWKMHEYKVSGPSRPVDGKDKLLDECVLCKIYKKVKRGKNQAQAQARPQPQRQPQQILNQGCNPFVEDPASFGMTNSGEDRMMMTMPLQPDGNRNLLSQQQQQQQQQQRGENENQLPRPPGDEELERTDSN